MKGYIEGSLIKAFLILYYLTVTLILKFIKENNINT